MRGGREGVSVCAGAGKVQHSGHTAAPTDTRASVGAHLWGLHAPRLQTQGPGFPTWLRLQLVEGGGLRPVILQSGGPCGGCVLYCLVGVAFVARWWALASEVRSFGCWDMPARWVRAISHHLCVFGITSLVCYGSLAARFGLCVFVCVCVYPALRLSVDDGRPPSSRA